MNGFYLRTEDGKVKAALMGNHATNVMRDAKGHWEGINFVKTGRVNVYIIDERAEYVSKSYGQCMVIYLFKGDYLYPM